MKIALILATFISFSIPLKAIDDLYVDVGFKGEDLYIAVNPEFQDNDTVYTFEICQTSNSHCDAISSCEYQEKSLKSEVLKIENSKVRNDFEWIFYASGYSSEEIRPFIYEFESLLKRANPSCQDLNLSALLPMS